MLKEASWPRVIKFHGKKFQVRLVSEEALRKDHPEGAPFADYDRDNHTIRIWRDLQHEARWTYLLHEILHLSIRIAHGRESGVGDDMEENLVEKIDTILYEILSNNFGFGYKEVRKVMASVNFYTLKGYNFDLLNPDENMIDIEEIAHCLAYQCRYNGHIPGGKFLSIAEHCVMVCERIQSNVEYGAVNIPLIALLHDAAEVYIGDIISPLKKIIPEIKEIEKGIEAVVHKKFGLEVSARVRQVVKDADNKVNDLEMMSNTLLRESGESSSGIDYLEPKQAEKAFMKKFREVYVART